MSSANARRRRRRRRPRPPGHRARSAPSGSAAGSRSRWCSCSFRSQCRTSTTCNGPAATRSRCARSSGSATTAATASSTPSNAGGTRTTRHRPAARRARSRCRTPSPTPPPRTEHRAPDLPADPAPRATDRSRPHARPRGGAQRGRVAADRAPGVGAACRLHHVRAPRRGAHLVLHGPDVARHQVAPCQLRRRHRATRRRAEPVGIADPGIATRHRDRRVQLGVQDGLRPRRRLPRRPGDRPAAERRGVARHQSGRVGERGSVGPRLHHVTRPSRRCARTSR